MVKTVNFLGFECMIMKHEYSNNKAIALELVDVNDNESVAMATVNIPNVKLEKDEVLIKNYSENNGIRNLLVDNKIISRPLEFNINGLDVTRHRLLKYEG